MTEIVTPAEILEVRNRVQAALEKDGAVFVGGGVSLINDPRADLDIDWEGHSYRVVITSLDRVYEERKESDAEWPTS